MPELPEVETVRRQLEPELVGKRIESAEVLDERLTRPEPPQAVERAVAGREGAAVGRRGLGGAGGCGPPPPRQVSAARTPGGADSRIAPADDRESSAPRSGGGGD